MDIILLSEVDIPETAKLYLELIHFLKETTHDPYYQFDQPPLIDNMISYLTDDYKNPQTRIYIVKDDNAIVGIAVGRIIPCQPPFKEKRIGLLAEAYIQPAYRGKGLMKKMEAMLLEFFKQNNVSYVELMVLSSNELGKKTWTALGYQTFREYMRKKL
jgi:ribosomal protein S18 acetylase RimI-like enzyme